MTWHLLQISDVLDEEFGSALAERVSLHAWEPARSFLPRTGMIEENGLRTIENPPLSVRKFPLMRGYARFPLSALPHTGSTVTKHLLAQTPDPKTSTLVCTTPYFASVAERWPGPVVYWLTDRIEKYRNVDPAQIHQLDRRLCDVATLVCPNSTRLADYLMEEAQCSPEKICVLPNATRASNISPEPALSPSPLPEALAGLSRPVAGVIGNLAGNLDWVLLDRLLETRPGFSWAFVGPTSMQIDDPAQSDARSRVMQHPNARFIGRRPYGELAAYARSFDVALLPYLFCEPTYSGSSTRFYEHLAASRPMLATRGFAELQEKEPLLRLIDSVEEASSHLEELKQRGFDDGLAISRWEESLRCTWQVRAETMVKALHDRLSPVLSRAEDTKSKRSATYQ